MRLPRCTLLKLWNADFAVKSAPATFFSPPFPPGAIHKNRHHIDAGPPLPAPGLSILKPSSPLQVIGSRVGRVWTGNELGVTGRGSVRGVNRRVPRYEASGMWARDR